jgi:prepilin-type N-terminal cleavage/methylation domain-containing protein
MFKRRKFTLIELIVVIAVLGILAAIVIPNISNFQNEARDAQLTADTRNIQTALDMYRLDQPDSISEPILEEDKVVKATQELDHEGEPVEISYEVENAKGEEKKVDKKFFKILDIEKLNNSHYLRQIPKYAVTNVIVTGEGTDEEKIVVKIDEEEVAPDGLHFKNGGKVVFAVLLETKLDDEDNPVAGESTAIVNALSYVEDDEGDLQLTVVR